MPRPNQPAHGDGAISTGKPLLTVASATAPPTSCDAWGPEHGPGRPPAASVALLSSQGSGTAAESSLSALGRYDRMGEKQKL